MVLMACSAPPHTSATAAVKPSSSAAMPFNMEGASNARTAVFQAPANWAAGWSYDCRPGLTRNGVIPAGAHCTFTIRVHRRDGTLLSDNNPFSNASTEGQGVLIYHTAGELYVEVDLCCTTGTWTLKVFAM